MHLPADKSEGDAVIVPVTAKVYAAVRGDLQVRVAAYLEVRFRKREQVGPVHGQEPLLAGVGMLLHALAVMRRHLLRHRLVEFLQRVEDAVPELGIDPPVDELHVVLHQSLVLRVQRTGGLDEAPVVVGHVLQHPVHGGLVTVCLDHSRLQVVGHEDFGHATYVLEEQGDGMHEVLRPLRGHAQRVPVVARRQAGHEGLHPDKLTRLHVDVAERVAGIVQKGLLSTCMKVREDGGRPLRLGSQVVLPVVVAELGEAVAAGVLTPVFLPQQLERHVGLSAPRHLLLQVGEKLLEALETTVGVCRVAALEAVFQHGVVELQQPVNAQRVGLGLAHIVVHRLLVHARHAGGLAVGEALLFEQQ